MSKIMNTTRPCITRFLVPDKTIVKPHWMRSVKSGYILLKKLVKSVNLESLPKIYVHTSNFFGPNLRGLQ